uniref:Uncharacterized protein n=1 Tax=Rhizophora mucronata TaxID=61149 RepID=A0A2P2K8U1_RHIMU
MAPALAPPFLTSFELNPIEFMCLSLSASPSNTIP